MAVTTAVTQSEQSNRCPDNKYFDTGTTLQLWLVQTLLIKYLLLFISNIKMHTAEETNT